MMLTEYLSHTPKIQTWYTHINQRSKKLPFAFFFVGSTSLPSSFPFLLNWKGFCQIMKVESWVRSSKDQPSNIWNHKRPHTHTIQQEKIEWKLKYIEKVSWQIKSSYWKVSRSHQEVRCGWLSFWDPKAWNCYFLGNGKTFHRTWGL